MAILDRETYKEMESLLYKHNALESMIKDYREEALNNRKNAYDATKYRKSQNKIFKSVEGSIVNLESDPEYIRLNKTKAMLDIFVEEYQETNPEQYRLIELLYKKRLPKNRVINELNISDSTYSMWKSIILNDLHKECLIEGLLDY